MNDLRTILILSATAAILLVLVLVGLYISPAIAIAIGPILLGIAAIVKAVRGGR